jgi:ParB family chromosome partitioning protein
MKLSDAKRHPRSRISCQSDGTKSPGRPRNEAVQKIMHEEGCSLRTGFRKLAKKEERKRQRNRTVLEWEATYPATYSPIIESTDNWRLNPVFYPRIDDDPRTYGYIPGDLYCNCLFYFTKPGDLVVAPMAGSGQIKCIYDDRARWMRPEPWDLDLRMFDLTPRGRYRELIRQWDMLAGFPPIERTPDYIIMDVPYFDACKGQYSSRNDDIANMDAAGWAEAMRRIARACAEVGAKRATIITPTSVNVDTDTVVQCPDLVRRAWWAEGYETLRVCYASKSTQAGRTPRIKVLNYRAKKKRIMLSDIAEVLTFTRSALS